ncbi:MAG: hypothetical protein HY364_02440 [Candidatus Aenigmarchaeota archaeon]|nr:hypothetical protein [Candidatus Aenigmarchaeota archaeon]
MKGVSQIDYVIGLVIFIAVVGTTVSLTMDYFLGVSDTARLIVLRSDAMNLLDSLEKPAEPRIWNTGPDILGIGGKAYRLTVLLNNTASNYFNPGVSAAQLDAELVSIDYASLGMSGIDVNSTAIYNESGGPVSYSIAGTNITFSTPASANEARWFTIYFDDNSNFSNRSSAVSGNNNVSERIYYAEEINLLEYQQIQRLQNSQYSDVRNSTGSKSDYMIEIVNAQTNSTYISFGNSAPTRGTVVSLERPVMFQNSTAAVMKGRLIVKTW